MIALKHLLYCSLLSPHQLFPLSLSACHADFCLKQEKYCGQASEQLLPVGAEGLHKIVLVIFVFCFWGGSYQSAVRGET